MAKEQLYSIPGLHQATTITPATAATNTATASFGVWRAPCDCKVVSIYQLWESAMTGRATNYRTFHFLDGGAAGTGTTAITGASKAFSATSVECSAAAPVDMSPTTPYELDEGDILVFKNELTGNGLAVVTPVSKVQIAFRAI